MPRACVGAPLAPCQFSISSVGRAAQPSPGQLRCLFCDLERLELLLAAPGGRPILVRMLRVSWLQLTCLASYQTVVHGGPPHLGLGDL